MFGSLNHICLPEARVLILRINYVEAPIILPSPRQVNTKTLRFKIVTVPFNEPIDRRSNIKVSFIPLNEVKLFEIK